MSVDLLADCCGYWLIFREHFYVYMFIHHKNKSTILYLIQSLRCRGLRVPVSQPCVLCLLTGGSLTMGAGSPLALQEFHFLVCAHFYYCETGGPKWHRSKIMEGLFHCGFRLLLQTGTWIILVVCVCSFWLYMSCTRSDLVMCDDDMTESGAFTVENISPFGRGPVWIQSTLNGVHPRASQI